MIIIVSYAFQWVWAGKYTPKQWNPQLTTGLSVFLTHVFWFHISWKLWIMSFPKPKGSTTGPLALDQPKPEVFTYHNVVERGFFYAMPWKPKDLPLMPRQIEWLFFFKSSRKSCENETLPSQKNTPQTPKKLGGGFKDFLFSSLPGEIIQFDEHIFQMGGSTTN